VLFNLLGNSRRKNIYRAHKSAEQAQLNQFMDIVGEGLGCRWAKEHGYQAGLTYSEFVERTPVSEYEDLAPTIEKMTHGEQGLLWPGKITKFSQSSGTTNNRSKYIPISDEYLRRNHYRFGRDMWNIYLAGNPASKALFGKMLGVGGTLDTGSLAEDIQVGDMTAIAMSNLPKWAKRKMGIRLETALMADWTVKLDAIAQETINSDIRSLAGVPSWTLLLIRRVMQMAGTQDIYSIWPNLEVFFHGAVAFDPYRAVYEELLGERMKYVELYTSSEGSFGIQDDMQRPGEMLLTLDSLVFYEFIPFDEYGSTRQKAVTIASVEIGRPYALVLTTHGGLWRYSIGDVISFTSTQPYRFKVVGRTRMFINAFGEELMVANADSAIQRANQVTNSMVTEYTAAPAYMTTDSARGYHEWAIEFEREPPDLQQYTTVLDETLREINSDYDTKRRGDMVLGAPVIHLVPQGTFYRFMQNRNRLGNQNKVPRLANERGYLEELLV